MTATRTAPRSSLLASAPSGAGGRRDRRRAPAVLAVGGGVLLVVLTHLWGRALQAEGHRLFLNLPPLVGHADLRFHAAGVVAVALAVAAIAPGPAAARRLRWRPLLVVGFAGAAAWAVALALTEGADGLTRSPAAASDYLASVPLMGDPLGFLRTYVERIDAFSTHVRAHPPAMALIAWTLDRLGGGPSWLAALEIGLAASAVPAVLIATREVAGEATARAAAPFLAVGPAAVTIASSGDAAFLGVSAWAVAATVLATGRPRAWSAPAVVGGLLFGVVAFLSYGLGLVAAVPLAVAVRRRRLDAIAVAALGAIPVFAGFLAAGFWWVDGLLATRVEYLESAARGRPYPYFLVANVAAFAIVLGPATLAALARWSRSAPVWTLVGGALLAVAIADLSGMSKAEVERIWLPFVPWVLVATSALPERTRRWWFGANVAFALALELVLRQPW